MQLQIKQRLRGQFPWVQGIEGQNSTFNGQASGFFVFVFFPTMSESGLALSLSKAVTMQKRPYSQLKTTTSTKGNGSVQPTTLKIAITFLFVYFLHSAWTSVGLNFHNWTHLELAHPYQSFCTRSEDSTNWSLLKGSPCTEATFTTELLHRSRRNTQSTPTFKDVCYAGKGIKWRCVAASFHGLQPGLIWPPVI